MKPSPRVIYFLILSAAAACLLLTVAYLAYSERGLVEEHERLVVGGLFIASCALCISMATRPNWVRRYWRPMVRQRAETEQEMLAREYVAHHPDCDVFQSHRIVVSGIEFCSGCLGLMIGSVISIVIVTIYLSLKPNIADAALSLAIAIGLSALFLTLSISLKQKRGSLLNTAVNICMIPGLCLLTIGMLEITGNLYAGLLSILFSFLWIDTRIQISQWRHSVACSLCHSPCKAY